MIQNDVHAWGPLSKAKMRALQHTLISDMPEPAASGAQNATIPAAKRAYNADSPT